MRSYRITFVVDIRVDLPDDTQDEEVAATQRQKIYDTLEEAFNDGETTGKFLHVDLDDEGGVELMGT